MSNYGEYLKNNIQLYSFVFVGEIPKFFNNLVADYNLLFQYENKIEAKDLLAPLKNLVLIIVL